jgi:cellulose synthase/poly-beta-1,6-N-acetylglucosamine synthase-like glycosyltransferase
MFTGIIGVVVVLYFWLFVLLILLVLRTNIKPRQAPARPRSKPQPAKAKIGSRTSWGIGLVILALVIEGLFIWWLTIVIKELSITSFSGTWSIIYIVAQVLYFFIFLVMFYFFTRKVNWVDSSEVAKLPVTQMPQIIMLYPVLHEDEDTMHTSMVALGKMDYPKDKYRIIAIPNSNDFGTIEILERLQIEFPFLEIYEVPPSNNPGWNVVWQAWESNPKAYWWHQGKTKDVQELPPKKTRQLVWAFYTLVDQIGTDWVLDYIDADSITPSNHFKLAAAGLQSYDVLQSTNVVGNLLDTPATTLHAFDHMVWDGNVYPHMSANGKHPYYLLGKGLFYKAQDLLELGCFNPWITIEDPEIGMRYWVNGKRLGIIAEPLIEEVPQVFLPGGITQRNRWMCGFYQSLASPLKKMGMTFKQRFLARLNIVPVMSHLVNIIGLPTGFIALSLFVRHISQVPLIVIALSIVNVAFFAIVMGIIYRRTWKRTKLVIDGGLRRFLYVLWVNPATYFVYTLLWCIPIIIGFGMFVANRGKVWKRTEKVDADRAFVRG